MIDKKVAFFIPEIEIGGVESNIINFSYFLKKDYKELLLGYLRKKNLEIEKKLSTNMRLIKLKDRRMLFMFLSFKEFIDRHQTDFLIVSSFMHLVHLVLLKLIMHKDLKIIFKVETNLNQSLKEQSIVDWLIYKAFGRLTFARCDLIICSCKSLKSSLPSLKNTEIKILYNPVVFEEHHLKKFKHADHQFFQNKHSKQVNLISVGRLVEVKGFEGLIDSFEILIGKKISFVPRLIILGSGRLEGALKELIEKKSLGEFIDIIPFNEKFLSYIDQSDIYVCNSSYEGLNNNIVHALSLGKQIISSDCMFGPREILYSGKLGRLIEPFNIDELVNAIIEIAESKPFAKKDLVARSRDFEAKKLSYEFSKILSQI